MNLRAWRRGLAAELTAAGFRPVRRSGGHEVWRGPGGGIVTLPAHRLAGGARTMRNIERNVRRAIAAAAESCG